MRNDGNVRKIVDTIRLPHSEATLIVRTSLKRYKEEHRIVVVWDAVLEVTGPTSMRFRERGWKVKRRAFAPFAAEQPAHSEPISIEQTCVRITPELRGAYSEQDLASGTLANVLIASYHEHTKLMHRINSNRLVTQFEKCTI
uniref:PRELI/MSF1 domain-containing protein n=1 Tax=Globisporangium ultimum (strain ATCC 200006 / CBS 805.95 / DAOM BR144) TaxID=431595 RepID=K3W912_GLOUD